jgi:hypothetical protein
MRRIFTLLFLILSGTLSAQTSMVKGLILHEDSKQPYFDVSVSIPKAKVFTTTDASGDYHFTNIPYGNYDMIISLEGVDEVTIPITVSDRVTTIDPIYLKEKVAGSSTYAPDNSASSSEDITTEDENTTSSAGQNVSSVLGAARDPFLQAATFGWGQYFFRSRGYENDNNLLFLNGVPMNDLEEGGVFFNSWSGLNDVFRGRTVSLGLAPTEYNFGGLGLNTSLDASASNQRKGTRLTYTLTNRNYRNRLMATVNSGLKKNGWAYSISISKRWAQEGNITGTYFDAYGYFGAIEKRFKKHGISLLIAGAPIERGKSGPATDEVYELAGDHFYNPYWGYQDGKKRNSRVAKSHQPIFVLTHDARLSTNTLLTSAISYQVGETSQSRINNYYAQSADPLYYRKLPSYQTDPSLREQVYQTIKSDLTKLQVNWDEIIQENKTNVATGYGNSALFLSEDVEYSKKLNVAINLESSIRNHVTFYTGVNYQAQNNHNFARVADLLGGQYVENLNPFALRNFAGVPNIDRFNLKDNNTRVKEGDTYQYDYNILFSKAIWFAQGVFNYNKFDFFGAVEAGYTGFYRIGNYQHAFYKETSYGQSPSLNFFTSRAKAGITYKLDGRNYFFANAAIGSKAPFVDNVMVSPRTRNLIISNPTTEKFESLEAGYLLRSPNVKGRITLYATNVRDAADIRRYFADDSASFANLAMQGINKRYTGIEAGAEVKVSATITLSGAVSLGQAFYSNRPYFNVYSDNDTIQFVGTTPKSDTAYIQNFYVPAGPQSAAQLAINYRNKTYWFFNGSINYMGRNYIDFAPTHRTREGVGLNSLNSPEWNAIVDQLQLPAFYTVDLMLGKSFKVNKYIRKAGNNTYLNFNLGISNALNNRDIKLYGFENMRTNETNPQWFAARYAYALGRQYFINLVLRN